MRYLLILTLFFSACSLVAPKVIFPKYDIESNMESSWLDMRKGEWVLYSIDAPFEVVDDLEQLANEEFTALANDFVSLSSGEMLIEKNISTFDTAQLKTFKEDLSADYLIYITAEKGNAETYRNTERELDAYGNNDFVKKKYYSKKVYTRLDVYDLNQGKLIYSKRAKGEASTDEAKATNIHTSSKKMIQKTLEMLLNDIKQNSYHK